MSEEEFRFSPESRFDKTAATAIIVAFRRSLSDIPLAKEIYELVKDRQTVDPNLLRADLAPQIEARYKIVDRYLRASGVSQVLEIASGLSPRGMNVADNYQAYVELDLPNMIQGKQRLINSLVESGVTGERPNLHLAAGNALNYEDLEQAASVFDRSQPIAVINEGLMRYLTMDERGELAKNIHDLLERFGGVWITPDISLQRIFESENVLDAEHVEKVSQLTGADIVGNRFVNVEEAVSFFERKGFSVEPHSWREVASELSSPPIAQVTAVEAEEMISLPVLFVMKPNN